MQRDELYNLLHAFLGNQDNSGEKKQLLDWYDQLSASSRRNGVEKDQVRARAKRRILKAIRTVSKPK